jgi:hypothetical protein
LTGRSYWPLLSVAVLGRFALPLLLLHPAWEFHRDELLYFAMGDHLELWGMQFPPLLPAIAALGKAIFGESVLAARVPAALGGVLVLLPMLLAVRVLGGGALALLLTALGSVAAPVFLRPSVLMHPVVFDQAWVVWALLGLVLASRRNDPRWWLLTGVALGFGALTKFTAAIYGVLLFLSALLTPVTRRHLRTRWPWLAAAVALALAAPSLVGQQVNDWPFLAQMRVLREHQLARVTVGGFAADQVLMLGPAALLALAGAGWALVAQRRAEPPRDALRVILGFAALLVGWFAASSGKPYYAGPAYPMLVAAGATWLEAATARLASPLAVTALRSVVTTLLVAGTVVLLPIGVPCLPPEQMARYAAALGMGTETNYGTRLSLPQDYADMLGWRDQVDAMAMAFRALTPEEQARIALSGGNYGQVAAIAVYGPSRGLPYPISTRSDFWRWGFRGHTGDPALVAISAGDDEGYRPIWQSLEEVGAIRDPWRVDEERDVRILRLRGIRIPLARLWQERGPGWD